MAPEIRIGIGTMDQEGSGNWLVKSFVSLAGLAGLVSLFWDSGSSISTLELVRTVGAIGFVISAADSLFAARRTRKLSAAINVTLMLLLAFDRASNPTKHAHQPILMTVLAAAIGVGLFAMIPMVVRLWRQVSDERDRAIVYNSMAFAFGVTLVGLLVYSMIQSLEHAPALQADWVLWTAIGAWAVSYAVLQRRM